MILEKSLDERITAILCDISLFNLRPEFIWPGMTRLLLGDFTRKEIASARIRAMPFS